MKKELSILSIIIFLLLVGCTNSSPSVSKRNTQNKEKNNIKSQQIVNGNSTPRIDNHNKEETNENIKSFTSIPSSNLKRVKILRLINKKNTSTNKIKKMKNLMELHLGNNNIENISFLANLSKVKFLWLGDNKIVDISSLLRLRKLVWLDLSGNKIKDISPLTSLNQLETLYLNDNQITNFEPLLSIPNLKKVRMWGNELNSEAQRIIGKLQSWGVTVEYQSED